MERNLLALVLLEKLSGCDHILLSSFTLTPMNMHTGQNGCSLTSKQRKQLKRVKNGENSGQAPPLKLEQNILLHKLKKEELEQMAF